VGEANPKIGHHIHAKDSYLEVSVKQGRGCVRLLLLATKKKWSLEALCNAFGDRCIHASEKLDAFGEKQSQ
jgi:hypothetical protein